MSSSLSNVGFLRTGATLAVLNCGGNSDVSIDALIILVTDGRIYYIIEKW